MRKALNLAISSRLEATKQHGLLQDYVIVWPASNFSPPHVKVRGNSQFPPQLTLNYVSALLDTLVPVREIEIER